MTDGTGDQAGDQKRKPASVQKDNVLRDELGRVMPGARLNPGGKPKGARNRGTILWEAIEAESKRLGIPFWNHVAEKAFYDDRIMIRVAELICARPKPEMMVQVDLPEGVAAPPININLAQLNPEARGLLRALLRAMDAPGASVPPTKVIDAEVVSPKKRPQARKRAPRRGGNGRRNGNGRKGGRKPKKG